LSVSFGVGLFSVIGVPPSCRLAIIVFNALPF